MRWSLYSYTDWGSGCLVLRFRDVGCSVSRHTSVAVKELKLTSQNVYM